MTRPVYVVGAGALGSLLGALLSRRTQVEIVGRPKHVEAIRRQGGLRVSVSAPGVYPLEVSERLHPPPPEAIVLLTVKAFDLRGVLTELAPRLDPSHLVVVLQNGLGIRTLATSVLGRPVLRAVTFMAAAFEAPGHVAFNAPGKTYFPAGGEVLDLWRSSGMPAEQVGDIDTYVWRKLAINAVINPLSALLGVPNGDLLRLRGLPRGLVEEVVQVASRAGQGLETEETLAKVEASMRQTARNTSSMLQDLRAGRQTEIEWINGRIVALAEEYGLDVPRNQQLLELVRFAARSAAENRRPAGVTS
ncbi:MAG TPA: 2-dehydropantoate 2-reductase [Candidatus Krumholzibacteria bacterium]|nr:2-dehydropantoate 2-reductase [Candidatus Krumholzibacteria bacterium]